MCRKNFSINFILSVIFLVTMVLPLPSFSYEKADYKDGDILKDERVDETLDYKPESYKKVRCPRCGMEFYYVPGKESVHSHWVYYEKTKRLSVSPLDSEGNIIKDEVKSGDAKLSDLFNKARKFGYEGVKEDVSKKISRKTDLLDLSYESPLGKSYELRQGLSCPYDGYNFFPDGNIIEDIKLMQETFVTEEPSTVEASFTKSIPFGISKELKQFGYDLFASATGPKKEKVGVDIEKESKGGLATDLATIGMLKAAFKAESISPVFSVEGIKQEAAVVPIQSDYILGPGDKLVINIWGSVQETIPVEIDREGKIRLPKAGPLYLWGLQFGEAEKRIKEKLNQFYTNFNVDISMGKLRNIQVFVMGEVKNPGSYVLNSQSNIFQALYVAGGPTKLGSLRKVKLMHSGGKEEITDLYPFLLQGEKIEYSNIQSGDTIFVPTLGDTVAIAGNVKRPAIYETRSGISLTDLLTFAGGITPTADLQRLQVERIRDNERRVMLDIEVGSATTEEASLKDINMQNGDMVIVSPIVRLKHDFVSVIGNVERPGDYASDKEMKVAGLIERAKGFMPGTYLGRAEICRVTADRSRQVIPVNLEKIMLGDNEADILLNEWDILIVYSESEVEPPSYVEARGAVNMPGIYELTPGIKVSDLIFKAGGVKPSEVIRGIELFHIIPGESPVISEISINQLSDNSISVDKDIILCSGDVLFVKSEPKLTERKTVIIKGEVRYPGPYSIIEGERFVSLIERAGGFTKEAFLDGAIFTRESIKEAQETMRRRFIEKENRSLLGEQQSILMRAGGESSVSAEQMASFVEMRTRMIESIAESEMKGRMVIKLMPPSQLKGTKYDILLEDGDMVTIPQAPIAITVVGSINNPTSVPFENGKGVEYYIMKTGGLTKHADKKAVYIVRANGEAISKFMMSKKVQQGDTIVVPQEFKYWSPPGQVFRDTVEVLSRIAVGVGIIAALE